MIHMKRFLLAAILALGITSTGYSMQRVKQVIHSDRFVVPFGIAGALTVFVALSDFWNYPTDLRQYQSNIEWNNCKAQESQERLKKLQADLPEQINPKNDGDLSKLAEVLQYKNNVKMLTKAAQDNQTALQQAKQNGCLGNGVFYGFVIPIWLGALYSFITWGKK